MMMMNEGQRVASERRKRPASRIWGGLLSLELTMPGISFIICDRAPVRVFFSSCVAGGRAVFPLSPAVSAEDNSHAREPTSFPRWRRLAAVREEGGPRVRLAPPVAAAGPSLRLQEVAEGRRSATASAGLSVVSGGGGGGPGARTEEEPGTWPATPPRGELLPSAAPEGPARELHESAEGGGAAVAEGT